MNDSTLDIKAFLDKDEQKIHIDRPSVVRQQETI